MRPDVLRTVYARLAEALDGIDVDPPERVRVAPDRVVADAVVLDAPYLQPLVRTPVVPAGGAPGRRRGPARPAAGRRGGRAAAPAGRTGAPWAELPGAGLAAARLGVPSSTGEVVVHGASPSAAGWSRGGRPTTSTTSTAARPPSAARSPGGQGVVARQALAEAFAHPDRARDLAAEDAVGE